ncbi:MAG: UDP-N-acetylmuramoyl-L-alanyl-D-glutamate--2,6-diaminopimelate ligase [Clostridia bacterium]
MNINKLLEILSVNEKIKDFDVSDIVFDSRKCKENCVFVCIVGSAVDGHNYAEKAVEMGAKVVVAQKEIDINAKLVVVPDTQKALALLSMQFFGHPYKKLKTIGITGTKGKTTTAFMLKAIIEKTSAKVGVIGTIGKIIGDEVESLDNTTPASYLVQKFMAEMVEKDCEYMVMEVSSIGLRDYRVYGFDFDCAVFTNFSHDHIGGVEHKDLDEYLDSKAMLFSMCKNAAINIDDEKADYIIEKSNCNITKFGFSEKADIKGNNSHLISENGSLGSSVDVSGKENFTAEMSIPGKFNAYNALSAITVAHILGIDEKAILSGLKEVKVRGRVEPVKVSDDFTFLLDYAHNAVSMENVLSTLREYKPNRLISIFGAGGNRPKVRRFEMGESSGNLADLSIITEDNSRFEEVLDIIEDIKTGINKTNGEYVVVPQRKEAIRYAIKNAQKGDIIVLAGKGSEDYLDIKGVKYPFDERDVIKEVMGELGIEL